MEKRNLVLIIVACIVIAIIIIAYVNYIYSQNQQLENQNKVLGDLNSPKSLNLNQNDVQITSVENQNSGVVCSNPSAYTNWGATVTVDVSNFVGGSGNLNYKDLDYNVNVVNFYVDSIPITANIWTGSLNKNNNRFGFLFSGVSPQSSHAMSICFSLENTYFHVTSNQVCSQYQISKLC